MRNSPGAFERLVSFLEIFLKIMVKNNDKVLCTIFDTTAKSLTYNKRN